jgi:hypothetical protein
MNDKRPPGTEAAPVDREEAAIRERLRAHEWPEFGAALAARLAQLMEAGAPEQVSPAPAPTVGRQELTAGERRPRSVPRESWAVLALLAVLIAGGAIAWQAGQTEPEQPVVAPVATPTPDLQPQGSATATEPSEAVSDSGVIVLTPVATVAVQPKGSDGSAGPDLDVAEWSPDSGWLPFWTAQGRDHYEFWRWPGMLHFLNANTGAVCVQPEVSRTLHSDAVHWEPDGRVSVQTSGTVATGHPCEHLAPAPESTYSLPLPAPGVTPGWAQPPPHEGMYLPGPNDSELSPSGDLSVTTVADASDGLVNLVTRVSRVAGGQIVAEVAWQEDEALGDWGIGGQWLSDDQFLINASNDHGPMLLRPDGTVIDVARDLFDQEPQSSSQQDQGDLTGIDYLAYVFPAAGDHIFLYATEMQSMAEHPEVMVGLQPLPLSIYHPETGQVETIAATRDWNPPLSPDGRWLVVVGNDGSASQREVLKVRPFEDPAAEFRNLMYASGSSRPPSHRRTGPTLRPRETSRARWKS